MNWTDKKEQLLSVPLPSNGGMYGVIPHSVLLEELNTELDKQGFTIENERYISCRDGQIMTGTYQLSSLGTALEVELKPSITFVNSYNKQRKASIQGGVQVLVCKNGMMGLSGSAYSRKHMGNNAIVDFRKHLIDVVGHLGDEFENMKYAVEQMKLINLGKDIRAQLVGDMLVNEKLITLTQVGILSREIDLSKDFKGTSLWDFYNHTTESFKSNHPMFYDRQHVKFHTYITDKFSLKGSRGLYGEPILVTGTKGDLNTENLEELFSNPEASTDIIPVIINTSYDIKDTAPYEFSKPIEFMTTKFADALIVE